MGEAYNKQHHRTGTADCGQRINIHRPADDQSVGHIVKLLEQIPDQQRNRKQEDQLRRAALG